MPKLKDFLIGQARKAGVTLDEAFTNAIPDFDVPDAVQTGIDNSLISITDAKNNHPDIKRFYASSLLKGVDDNINDLLSEFEVDDAVKAEILKETSTYKRVPLAAKKLIELQAAKAAANSGKDKSTIQKEIDKLHADIAAEKQARAADKAAFEGQMTQFKINSKIQENFSKFKTIHDELDPEVKNTVLSTLISKELQDKQGKFGFDEAGNFTLLKSDGTNFYGENHTPVTPSAFIEQTLAKTKQLKVTNGQPPTAKDTQGRRPIEGEKTNPNASVIDLNAAALADYDKGTASAPGR